VNIERITPTEARQALMALRYAKPLKGNSLLEMRALRQYLQLRGAEATPGSLEWALGVYLEELIWSQLSRLRGRSIHRTELTPEIERRLLDDDFQAGSTDREVWSLLYYRFISEFGAQFGQLASIIGLDRRTLERRLTLGYGYLARLLREEELQVSRVEADRDSRTPTLTAPPESASTGTPPVESSAELAMQPAPQSVAQPATARSISGLPSGTVTFMFTDVEHASYLWEAQPAEMRIALAHYSALLTANIEAHAGRVVATAQPGDSFLSVFEHAADALAAACTLQQAMRAGPWPTPTPIKLRVALHTGDAEFRDDHYIGPAVNRCARLRELAHGSQTLLSRATYELVRDARLEGIGLAELGEHCLRDLTRPEQVYQLCHADLPTEFPPLRSLDAFPNNLPVQLSSFVGREDDVTQVRELLRDGRMVTIQGFGGIGKTRLGLQIAADLLDDFEHGVWFVGLDAIGDPKLVPQAIAAVLALQEAPDRTLQEAMVQHLRPRSVLLFLDNCEHLIEACAAVAESILQTCPKVKILTSSREALRISGERVWPLAPLGLPKLGQLETMERLTQCAAVKLFVDRAQAANPGFEVTAATAPAVSQICLRLDGIPLAIELAAARIKVMSAERVAQRLENRFQFLRGGRRTAMPRHQTLQAAVDWSYDLLDHAERRLFNRLSAFAGSFSIESAEVVCGDSASDREDDDLIAADDVLDIVAQLVEKSLVVAAPSSDSQDRCRMLETLRQYGRQRLRESGEAEDVGRRHAEHFLALAEVAEAALSGPRQAQWLDRLAIEHDNLRAALEWAKSGPEGSAELGLRLAGALARFWLTRGYLTEGRGYLTELLSSGNAVDPAVRAKALDAVGTLARQQCDYAVAREWCVESLALKRELDDQAGIAGTLRNLGSLADEQGHYGQAQALYEESAALYRALGNQWGIAAVLNNMGISAAHQGDYGTAQPLLEESLELFRNLGERLAVDVTLYNLGNLAFDRGEFAHAESLYELSLVEARELDDQVGIASALRGIGNVAYRCGDLPAARRWFLESLTILSMVGDKQAVAEWIEAVAALDRAEGHAVRATRLFAASEALRDAIGSPVAPKEQAERDAHLAALRVELGEADFQLAWSEGHALTWQEAIGQVGLGHNLVDHRCYATNLSRRARG
jgi:predicted ATPase/class 3 adenylate cyclase